MDIVLDNTFAHVYTGYMNTEKAEHYRKIAKRTLKIISLIEKGFTSQEVVELTGANRQLVDYYFKQLK